MSAKSKHQNNAIMKWRGEINNGNNGNEAASANIEASAKWQSMLNGVNVIS
jgi:hypothetical protein